MPVPNIKPGDRVKLMAFEDSQEEEGEVLSVDFENEMCVVCDDEQYRENPMDDGLRDTPLDQIIL